VTFNSAFRISRSALAERIRKVIRQLHWERQPCRQVVGAHVVHEHEVVVHRLRRQQDEIQVPPIHEGPLDGGAGEQSRRGDRRFL